MILSHPVPLTEKIRLEIFESPDFPGFPGNSFEWRELSLLRWKLFWKFGDSRKNVFNMHGDSRENLMKIVVVVMIWSPISSVRGRSPSVLPYIELSYMCIYPYIQSSAIKHMYVYIKGIYTYTYTIYKYIHHTAFTLYFPT